MLNYAINKRKIFILSLITISIVFITLRSELTDIVQLLIHVKLSFLFLGILCILIFWYLEALVFHLMLGTYDKKLKFKDVLKLVLSTQFFNGITPFSTGGQPFQIFVLNKVSKIKISSATSASIHNFIVYQCILVFMGSIAIFVHKTFNIFPSGAPNLKWIALAGFILNLIVIISLIIIAVSPKLTNFMVNLLLKICKITPLRRKITEIEIKVYSTVEEFHNDIESLMANKSIFYKALFLNFIKLLIFYTIAYFISLSVDFDQLSILQAIIASAYVMLITSIVPLPGAAGGAELGFLVFFGAFIVGAKAKAIMLLWRFITYYLGLIIGFFTFQFGYIND